jgi:hypothetical protein
MKKKYVIENPVINGYWAAKHKMFKGVNYATLYDTEEAAEKALPTGFQILKITPVYVP